MHKVFRILLVGVAKMVEWPLIGLLAVIYAADILRRRNVPDLEVVGKDEQELIERRLAELLAQAAVRNSRDTRLFHR